MVTTRVLFCGEGAADNFHKKFRLKRFRLFLLGVILKREEETFENNNFNVWSPFFQLCFKVKLSL
jgi:hypothetical protein